mgnify:CR=1 FL=1
MALDPGLLQLCAFAGAIVADLLRTWVPYLNVRGVRPLDWKHVLVGFLAILTGAGTAPDVLAQLPFAPGSYLMAFVLALVWTLLLEILGHEAVDKGAKYRAQHVPESTAIASSNLP